MLDISTIIIYADQGVRITGQTSEEVLTTVVEVPSLSTFIQHIQGLTPENVTQTEYKRIDIDWGVVAHYKGISPSRFRNSFSVSWENLDTNTVEALRQEISTL